MTGMRVEDLQAAIDAVGDVEVVRKPFKCSRILQLLSLSDGEPEEQADSPTSAVEQTH
jgi:hypothetical protein